MELGWAASGAAQSLLQSTMPLMVCGRLAPSPLNWPTLWLVLRQAGTLTCTDSLCLLCYLVCLNVF